MSGWLGLGDTMLLVLPRRAGIKKNCGAVALIWRGSPFFVATQEVVRRLSKDKPEDGGTVLREAGG